MKKLLHFIALYLSVNNVFSQINNGTPPFVPYELSAKMVSCCYKHNIIYTDKCSQCVEAARLDTTPSSILISHKPPSFGHSIDGYCIYQGDHCTGKHLRYWHRRWIVIGPEYTVWGCKRRGKP
jgi:hypothetical protein